MSLETSTGTEVLTDESAPPCRPLRADAQQNRLRILEAAESLFALEGLGVPVDLIAQKACVGVGTVYRHFPTKETLFQAIVISRFEQLACEARQRIDAEDPAAALFGFLEEVATQGALKRDLVAALAGAGIELEVVAADMKKELEHAVTQLLARGQKAGSIREDITAHELMTMVGAACMAQGNLEPEAGRRMIRIICDGVRAEPPA